MHKTIGSFEIGVMIDDRTTTPPPPSPTKRTRTSIFDFLIKVFEYLRMNY
jgi:hypothetical protein